jgi:hypothetical protein
MGGRKQDARITADALKVGPPLGPPPRAVGLARINKDEVVA